MPSVLNIVSTDGVFIVQSHHSYCTRPLFLSHKAINFII